MYIYNIYYICIQIDPLLSQADDESEDAISGRWWCYIHHIYISLRALCDKQNYYLSSFETLCQSPKCFTRKR